MYPPLIGRTSQISSLAMDHLHLIVNKLPKIGIVKVINEYFSYLDVDDNFIHEIYSLIRIDNKRAIKPEYFDEKTHFIGAHISMIYPEEHIIIDKSDIGKWLSFEITGLFTTCLVGKKYYALKVTSTDLLNIRSKYGLANSLQLYGHLVDLHLTVALEKVRQNKV